MPRSELTDRFCRSASAGDGRKTDYFDTLVRGLCLRASAGGAKAFYQVYTRNDGKRAWLKLGTFPDISLAKARQLARETRASVGEGNDPHSEKTARAASQTVSDLVDNYVAREASTKRSAAEIERRLRFDVVPLIGDIKLSELHRRDLTRCIDAIMDRGAHAGANRLFDDIRAMVRWAKARGDLDENLVDGMRRPAESKPRDRVLSADEIRTIWEALPSAKMWASTQRILRLCLVTAQRVGEITGMERGEIDFERQLWTIPASRSKNGREHTVPLSGMALDIIKEQLAAADALAERKDREAPLFVFPGPGGRAAVTGASISKAVKREQTGETILSVAPFTPHDLRRTAATHMEEIGVNPFIVGHVLNHISVTKASITSRVYARYDYAAEKREALDLWADRLSGIFEQKTAEVVSLAR